MHHAVTALDLPVDEHKRGVAHRCADTLVDLGTEDEVGGTGLVLDGHEDNALGGRRPLPQQHKPRNANLLARRRALLVAQEAAWDRAQFLERRTQARDGVALEGHPGRIEVPRDLREFGHRGQRWLDVDWIDVDWPDIDQLARAIRTVGVLVRRWRVVSGVAIGRGRFTCTKRPEGPFTVTQREDLPDRLLTVERHRTKRIGRRQTPQRGTRRTRDFREIGDGAERAVPRHGLDDPMRLLWLEASNHAKSEPDGRLRGTLEEGVSWRGCAGVHRTIRSQRGLIRRRWRTERLGSTVAR